MPSSQGELKSRRLVYYYGVDAIDFIPEEIKDGFDVLWVDGAPLFTDEKTTNKQVLALLNKNGYHFNSMYKGVQLIIAVSTAFLKSLLP